ncbi:unnamed protein product [Periconia digitata]|uniref:Uncharacterized protein n=1 Tax=Periconia digitata TaxID=1303443 RepID=A0A9W4UEX8_9PLEO|nr:unnamed protein product [Periconia digitata]
MHTKTKPRIKIQSHLNLSQPLFHKNSNSPLKNLIIASPWCPMFKIKT